MNTKKCKTCNEVKPLSEFGDRYNRDCKRAHCKDCWPYRQSKYNRKHRIKKRKLLNKYKTRCLKCGESRTYVLVFHHINPEDKELNVSNISKHTIQDLKHEMAKCIVLCANCHRDFHYHERVNDIDINKFIGEKPAPVAVADLCR